LSSAVAARLKNQYVLTYQARKIRADGQAHTIRIQVEKDGARGQDTLKFIAPDLGKERSRYLPFGLGLGVIFLAVLALLLRGRFKAR
ncbi:MAG: hypothetical protein JRI54_13790, partial [Deltaproteobacteria bacterium]|nr:hypothetical protein [Deltaproteobacteria bacterium]